MNAWQRLGIEPTPDIRQIKRAYAKELKLIDQDTQPDEFIQLRQALHEACFEAEYELGNTNEEEIENAADTEHQSIESNPSLLVTASSSHSVLESNLASDLQLESSSSLSHHDEAREQWLHQHEPEQWYDFEELIQRRYVELEQNVIERNIHFDIPDALKEIVNLLNQYQQNDLSAQYHQRIIQLLQSHQLEDFISFIDHNIEQEQSLALSETQQHDFHDDLSDDQSSTTQTEDFSSSSFAFEELTDAMWQSDLSDSVFEKFQRILNMQTSFSLGQQIWIKDQLLGPLASANIETLHPNYIRFLDLWLNHYPDDFYHYPDGYHANQLQERLQYYIENKDQIDFIPRDQFPLLELLEGDQTLQSKEILTLKKQLEQRRPDLDVMDTVAIFHLENIQTNPNFVFLKSLVIRKNLFLINCLFTLINFIFLEYLFKISTDTFYNALISVVGGWSFFYFIQPYILTYLAARPNQDDLHRNFSLVWFISGLLLCAFSALIPPPIHMVLSYIWILLSIILIGFHEVLAAKLSNNRIQYTKIKLDTLMVYTALLVIIIAIIFAFALIAKQPTPWSVFFALIPISLLLYPDSSKQLMFAFGRIKSDTEMSYAQFIRSTLIRILFRFTLFVAIAYFLVSKTSEPYFYLASACILSLCLAASNTSWMTQCLKVFGYLISILICLVLVLYAPIIGGGGLWLLFYTMNQQQKAS